MTAEAKDLPPLTYTGVYPPGVKWDDPVHVRAVPDMLTDTVRTYGSRPAFDFLGKKSTWADIGDEVARFACGLQQMGVRKGTKVGLFLPNTQLFMTAYYAILTIGGTVVNFNPLYAPRELKHQIEDSETEIMITADLKLMTEKMEQMVRETALRKVIVASFAGMLPFPKNILFQLFKRGDIGKVPESDKFVPLDFLMREKGPITPVEIDPQNDIAVLQYTGGTTGTPKGAQLTHANITANAEQAIMWFYKGEAGKERVLGVLPFFHVFAMTSLMNLSVRMGLELVTIPRFEINETLKLIDRKKPTFFAAVPAIYNAINNHPDRARYDLTSLKYCISGGAPLPVEVKKTFETNTGCVVVEGYGLSETSPIVCVNPIEGENKPGSIGLPVPQTVVEIIDPADRVTPMKPGERGELCVAGPQVMSGYWKKPEETAHTLKNGRLHTGDIAYMDADGYVFIVDRIKDLIITNGYNVYPRNVEEAIYLHPAVEECIVAGLPDASRGEIVKAWIKLKPGQSVSTTEMKEFLEKRISKIEIPRTIEFRENPLPKTMIGKLSRKDILIEEKMKSAQAAPQEA